jgi:hypothetical protein
VGTFASGKGDDPCALLRTLGVGAGAVGAAATMGGTALGPVTQLAIPVVGVWSTLRTKTVKGFCYELVPRTTSTTVLAAGAAEFKVPLASFQDGHYAFSEPFLLKLTVSPETQMRVAGTARAERKESVTKGPGEPKVTGKYRRDVVTAEITKADEVVTVKANSLIPSEYGLGFMLDGTLLPQILDFTVR